MKRKAIAVWLSLPLFATFYFACGSSNKGGEKDGGEHGKYKNKDSGIEQDAEADGATGDAAEVDAGPRCGDEVVQPPEQCDDGNFDNTDGCTTLCEWTCESNDTCDDQNPCNGTETCNVDKHTCILASELEDGEPCGSGKSCWKGICLDDVCGDGFQQGDEQCDDGNLDPNDGCKPDCTFTCVSESDCAGKGECAATGDCDLDTHMCTGKPAADKTSCDNGNGWCMNGVCVPHGCGDGTKAGDEQCDKGSDNGKPGSGCTIDCKIAKCGDGKLQGDEECDDGNKLRLDGCGPDCKVEFMTRWTRLDVVRGYVPEFCVHQGNRFGSAYPEALDIFPGVIPPIDVLQKVNQVINQPIADGTSNTLMLIMDSSDTSMRTVDKEITVGIFDGVPAKTWEAGPPLDFPFLVSANAVDENRMPKESIVAEQGGGGRVLTNDSFHVKGKGPTGAFEMYDTKVRVLFDVSKLSAPTGYKFDLSEAVQLPETGGVGEGDPTAADYRPAGTMCGAMTRSSQEAQPVTSEIVFACCSKDGEPYKACADNKVTADCNNYSDVVVGGCKVCFDLTTFTNVCAPGCSGLTIILPIDPDVDTDNDGEPDSFSTVFAFEGKRIRVAGISE